MILSLKEYPDLPKWPAAFVTGNSVTPNQAKDIIFRTDTSCTHPSKYGFGNDHEFEERCIRLFGWDKLIEYEQQWYDKSIEERDASLADHPTPFEIIEKWQDQMQTVGTQYTDNNWLASCYVGGPHGWCNPDGKIHSNGHNYGKWPTVEEVVGDWTELVTAFPYLDLVCTLFDSEQCTPGLNPVCSIIVKNGIVEVHAPDLTLHEYQMSIEDENLEAMVARWCSNLYDHEHGWPQEWVDEFGAKSTKVMQEIAPFLFVEDIK